MIPSIGNLPHQPTRHPGTGCRDPRLGNTKKEGVDPVTKSRDDGVGRVHYAVSFTHFPPFAEDFKTASMKAIPFTPSLTVGKSTALSGFFFDLAARMAAAASV